jgi:hypothetical protein
MAGFVGAALAMAALAAAGGASRGAQPAGVGAQSQPAARPARAPRSRPATAPVSSRATAPGPQTATTLASLNATAPASRPATEPSLPSHDPRPLMKELEARKKPTDATPFTFTAFGDWQGWEKNLGVYAQADKLQPDFCLFLGDMVNDGSGEKGLANWQKLERCGGWFFRKYPCWAALGNHEIGSGEPRNGPARYAAYWAQPINKYFSFTYANAKFIGTPMQWPSNASGLKALEAELAAAEGKHIFLFGHMPYYTVGQMGTRAESIAPSLKLFAKYKVTAVFGGHEHIYYRTRRDGVNYVVAGTGGGGIHTLSHTEEAAPGDVYYGQEPNKGLFKFHHPDRKEDAKTKEAAYFLTAVTVEGPKVTLRLLDAAEGKEWDRAVLAGEAKADLPATLPAPKRPAVTQPATGRFTAGG